MAVNKIVCPILSDTTLKGFLWHMSNIVTLCVLDITKHQTFQSGDVHMLQEEDIRQITDAISQGGW